RRASGDAAVEGELQRLALAGRHGARDRRGEAATDDLGGEAAGRRHLLLDAGGGLDVARQAHHLHGPGAVRQAADEAALLQAGDQAVDAGLGPEVERVLHLIKGWRDAVALQVPVDEEQKLVLLFGEHGSALPPVCRPSPRRRHKIWNKTKTRLHVLVWFSHRVKRHSSAADSGHCAKKGREPAPQRPGKSCGKDSTSTVSPRAAADACGARTMSPSAAASRASMEESWRP